MARRLHAGTQAAWPSRRIRSGLVHLVATYRFDAPGVAGRITYAGVLTLCGLTPDRYNRPGLGEARTCARCLRLAKALPAAGEPVDPEPS